MRKYYSIVGVFLIVLLVILFLLSSKSGISIEDFEEGLTVEQLSSILSEDPVPVARVTEVTGSRSIEIGDAALNNQIFLRDMWDMVEFTDWSMDPFNNTSWELYLNSLYTVSFLLNAYETTHEIEYFNKATAIMEDWIVKNPNNSDTHNKNNWAWADHSVSNRLLTMNYMIEVMKEDHLKADEKFMNLLLGSLKEHLEYQLSDDNYRFPHNHGVMQDRSVIQTYLVFSEVRESKIWLNTALERLEKQIDAFVSDSGVHLEHSPFYHVHILELYDSIGELLNVKNESFTVETNQTLEAMQEYLMYILRPDLLLPFIGDSTQYVADKNYNNNYLEYVISQGNSGIVPPETDKVYMDAGIGIFRDEWKDSSEYEKMSHLVFHAGYHSSVHKHADDLSFTFNSLGEDILIDPGKYTYSDNIFGDYFRSSKAHNTITVDNKSYNIKGSEKYGTAIKDYKLTDDYAWITAEHSIFKGVTVSRTMLYIKPNVIVLLDSLNSSTNHSYQQVLNLGKKFEIDSNNATANSVEAYIPGKDVILNIEQLAGAESWKAFKGHHDESDKVNPVRGFASPETDQLYEMYQLEFEKSGKNTEFVTVLSVDSSEFEQMATDIEVMQSGKSIQVSYNLNGLKQSINIPIKK